MVLTILKKYFISYLHLFTNPIKYLDLLDLLDLF